MSVEPSIEDVLWQLPADIAAEFDCVRGPHDWLKVTALGVTHHFCRDCPKVRITR